MLTGFVGYVTLGAAHMILGSRLVGIGWPSWGALLVALFVSALVALFVWRSLSSIEGSIRPVTGARSQAGVAATTVRGRSLRSADEPRGAMLMGAVIVGFVGFAGGYFGPGIFDPSSNQGPLLGVFITGPLGCAVGAGVGWFWWASYKGSNKGKGDAG